MEEILSELVLNWDHTRVHYVPTSNWTMERMGSKRIEVVGLDDKRQITLVFGASMSGDFLPPQVKYSGKTTRCLPPVKFPDDWNITYTENHWANENTTEVHIKKILISYIESCRKKLHLSTSHAALVVFDRFTGQCTLNIMSLLESYNIRFVTVPPHCTDRLQPLDASVNKAAKDCLRKNFQEWYSNEVRKHLDSEGRATEMVDLSMCVVKPLGALWLMNTFNYIKSNPSTIIN